MRQSCVRLRFAGHERWLHIEEALEFLTKDDDLTAECETHFLPGTDVFFFLLVAAIFNISFVKDVANLILWR